jgi:hypothetical protein
LRHSLDDITKLITALRDTAQTFPDKQREEALVHLDDLQEDLSKPEKQKPQRIKTRLVALLAIATTVSGLVAGAADFSNTVLELSEKLDIELIQLPPNRAVTAFSVEVAGFERQSLSPCSSGNASHLPVDPGLAKSFPSIATP